VTFHPELRARVHFVEHSLATDAAFAEVQLVSCRNVLIYFGQALRDRAVDLFHGALCPRGFLGLGARETLLVSAHVSRFVPVSEPARIYRRS
jgi:chemotaxis protein methyltransferase CheR